MGNETIKNSKRETPVLKCSQPGCKNTIKAHYWGKTKAGGWFFQKSGEQWCPDHHPEWVSAWRAKKSN